MTPSTDEEDSKLQVVMTRLMALPTAQKKPTKKELVNRLSMSIDEARRKGHSLRLIAQQLQDSGLDISYSTLRNCLPQRRRPSKNRGAVTEKAAKKPPAPTVASTETPPAPATTRETAPPASVRKPAPKPTLPQKRVFPPGASFIPIGNGQFLPAPDSDDL